jgi:hypothetical protein
MKKSSFLLSIIAVGLTFNTLKSQTFFESNDISLNINYGYGKIVYYFNYTPTYIGAANNEAAEYSPSWSFKVEKSFWLNDRFDFSLGLGHITITEKTRQTAKPDWFDNDDKSLTQGFFHIIPCIRVKLPDKRFSINLGLRMGTASFIGSSDARFSSNSFGELHADIDTEFGASILINKKLFLEAAWIHGLTKYDYFGAAPATFYKYHSFQFGLRYILRNEKKTK